MANIDAGRGFNPVTGGTAGNTVTVHEYTAATSVTFSKGQLVSLTAGVVNVYQGGTTLTRNRMLGSVLTSLASATTDRSIWIADDPAQEFEVQLDSVTANVTTNAGLRGMNFAIAGLNGANNTLTVSTSELDSNSGTNTNNTTTVRPIKGLRFSQEIDNDQTVSWGNVIVKINPLNHIYATALQ